MSDEVFEDVVDTLNIPLNARVYASKRLPEHFLDPKPLELEDGRITQRGTHKELLTQEGAYRNLIALRREAVGWTLAA